jgi:hypothetical protein
MSASAPPASSGSGSRCRPSNANRAPSAESCASSVKAVLEHPEDYASHPPVFLAQSALSDSNADLCAGRSYHETLLAHGVKTEIALLPGALPCSPPADLSLNYWPTKKGVLKTVSLESFTHFPNRGLRQDGCGEASWCEGVLHGRRCGPGGERIAHAGTDGNAASLSTELGLPVPSECTRQAGKAGRQALIRQTCLTD